MVAHFTCAKVDNSWHFAKVTHTQVICSCMTRARGANLAHFVRIYESPLHTIATFHSWEARAQLDYWSQWLEHTLLIVPIKFWFA
jgi:hypothetical protein